SMGLPGCIAKDGAGEDRFGRKGAGVGWINARRQASLDGCQQSRRTVTHRNWSSCARAVMTGPPRKETAMMTAVISLLGSIPAALIIGVFISVLLQLEDIDRS